MRFWWVNQNQTYRQEVRGGYLWSPKLKANGAQNPFYDFMREMSPGDVVFSFAETWVKAVGLARSFAYEAPKPLEFGTAGAYWDQIGWRVDVRFHELSRGSIRPSQHMAMLAPLLPPKYSPLLPSGSGLQSVYLTRVEEPLAAMLVDLIGPEARALVSGHRVSEALPEIPTAIGLVEWEEHELARVRSDESIPETDRAAVVLARRGQGLFKQRVMRIERACRVTGVSLETHLRASHCKPWRDASNDERLDGENGLLLTPTVDHLFDRGFIGFEGNGDLIVAPVASRESLLRMGVEVERLVNVGTFSEGQRRYLEYHRENVLLKSRFLG
jgi:putative restriction endonuclease